MASCRIVPYILALSTLFCLAPVVSAHAQVSVRGLLAAARGCDLSPGDAGMCSAEATFLGGELEFRGRGRVDAVSVDRDGVFEASLPQGTYRVSLRKLRLGSQSLNPKNFRLSKRRVRVDEGTLLFLGVRHRSRSVEGSPGIGA